MKKSKIILFKFFLIVNILFYYCAKGQTCGVLGISMTGEIKENRWGLNNFYRITEEKRASTNITFVNNTDLELKLFLYKESDLAMIFALAAFDVSAWSRKSYPYGSYNVKIFKKAFFDVLLTTKKNVTSDVQMSGTESTFSAVRISSRKPTIFYNKTTEELKVCTYNKDDLIQAIPFKWFILPPDGNFTLEPRDYGLFRVSVFKPAILDQAILSDLFQDQSIISIESSKISTWTKLTGREDRYEFGFSEWDFYLYKKDGNGMIWERKYEIYDEKSRNAIEDAKRNRIWFDWVNTNIQDQTGNYFITASGSPNENSIVFCIGPYQTVRAKWLKMEANRSAYNVNSNWEDFGGKTDCAPVFRSEYNPSTFGYYSYLFIRNADDGSVRYRVSRQFSPKLSSGWSDWINIGGKTVGKPAIAFRSLSNDGYYWKGVFARSENNTLLYRGVSLYATDEKLDSWNNARWIDLGGQLAGSPAVVSWDTRKSGGRSPLIFVIARFTDNTYYYRYYDGNKWDEWTQYATEKFASDPIAYHF